MGTEFMITLKTAGELLSPALSQAICVGEMYSALAVLRVEGFLSDRQSKRNISAVVPQRMLRHTRSGVPDNRRKGVCSKKQSKAARTFVADVCSGFQLFSTS